MTFLVAMFLDPCFAVAVAAAMRRSIMMMILLFVLPVLLFLSSFFFCPFRLAMILHLFDAVFSCVSCDSPGHGSEKAVASLMTKNSASCSTDQGST